MSTSAPYSELPGSKAELLERIDREWQELWRVVAHVRPEQMEVPGSGGWSIKDNLAHIAEWERFMRLHHLGGLPPHEVLGIDESQCRALDEDGLNAIIFERNRGRSVAEVSAGLRDSHEQVLRDLAGLSFAEMMDQEHAERSGTKLLLEGIVDNTYTHYREHCATIERLAGQ